MAEKEHENLCERSVINNIQCGIKELLDKSLIFEEEVFTYFQALQDVVKDMKKDDFHDKITCYLSEDKNATLGEKLDNLEKILHLSHLKR
jgi:hypothetical protein